MYNQISLHMSLKARLGLWECLFDTCLVDMVRDICEFSYEDWLTTDSTNSSRSTFEEISTSGLILAQMRRQVNSKPDTVLENQRTSNEYEIFN